MEDNALETPVGISQFDMDDGGFVIPPENLDHTTDDELMEEVRSNADEDASFHESSLISPVASSSSRLHKEESHRKFKIENLNHPGEYTTHMQLQAMLARCSYFTISFKPSLSNSKKAVKKGSVSIVWDSHDEARIAFAEAQQFVIDGHTVRLQASKSFYEATNRHVHKFTLSEEYEVRERTVYALYLLESTSEEVLEGIFGPMESVQFMHFADHKRQAEIVMKTKEAAQSAKEDGDGFDLNDGENTSVMKVFFTPEYDEFVTILSRRLTCSSPAASSSSAPVNISRSDSNASSCSKPSISPVKKEHHKEDKKHVKLVSTPTPILRLPQPLPLPSDIPEDEPSIDEVAASIELIVDEERINYAEINEKEELYSLIDKASYKLGGVRDELLRDSLLSVMERARTKAVEDQSNWMKRHLENLIKLWKKEIASGIPFDRPSRVPLQARVINPIPKEKKRKRGGGAMLRSQFGIGSVLAAARAKFATEEGELDIEETDDGDILIGDVPLSFDSWARFNKQPLKRAAPKEEKIAEAKDNRRLKRAKIEEEKKKKKEEEKAKKEAGRPRKELEEGEMDSDDSEGDKKSDSSSSSSDSDDEGDSRRRRRFRRKNDRNKPPTLPVLFQSIYDNRVAIIGQLSVEHRVAFSKVLTQFVNQKGGIDSNQQRTLMNYMANFQR